MSYPILEFDSSPEALIEPSHHYSPLPDAECCVVCFFREVVHKVVAERHAQIIATFNSELCAHPLYQMDHKGRKVAFLLSGVGAPLAVGILEEVIAHGFTKIVACGGAGVLDKDIQVGRIVIPSSALRDEGTSYHYAAPAREINIPPEHVEVLAQELRNQKIEYLIGKTWTTDAFYRETKAKIENRKAEGCITVEMECSAFAALCQFRKVKFAQYLYGGDDVSGNEWSHRGWNRTEVREKLFWTSLDACINL
jgi:uridine phosphorylase